MQHMFMVLYAEVIHEIRIEMNGINCHRPTASARVAMMDAGIDFAIVSTAVIMVLSMVVLNGAPSTS